MLLQQDEYCPRIYLGKDEVECGNTASMTRGGPRGEVWFFVATFFADNFVRDKWMFYFLK